MTERKTVLITGASRGIGRVIALAFGSRGWHVAVNYVKDAKAAEECVAEVAAAGGTAAAVQADVADQAQVQAMVKSVAGTAGRIDALVHCAAVCRDRTILNMSVEEWDAVMNTDLRGSFFVVQECGKLMSRQRGGSIIVLSSIVGMRGSVGNANYAAAKAGLTALAKGAARELGRFGVRVNTILPGFHLTGMGKTAPAAYIEKIKAESVLGCTTDIHELAAFVGFLSETTTISGQVFNWDSRIL